MDLDLPPPTDAGTHRERDEGPGASPPAGGTVTLTLNPALDNAFTVPRLLPTSKIRCGAPQFHPGGGGVNVARILTDLGEPATAVLPIAGHIGLAVADLLAGERVSVAPLEVAGETRQSHHISDLQTGLEYRLVLPGPPLSRDDQLRCLDTLRSRAQGHSFVVLSGSFPPCVEPAFVAEVGAVAREVGARLVVDTSGPPLAAVRHAYLLKPSVRELSELVGRPLETYADQVAGARDMVIAGSAEVVLVSRGNQGVVVVTEDSEHEVPAIEGPLVSTVGAGDALVAGVVAGLRRKWTLLRAVRLGVACSAAMVRTPGTSLFGPDEVRLLSHEDL